MPNGRPAKLVRFHLSEGDRSGDIPLHEAIVERCRALGIAGATVFRGLEGYGESAAIHRGHILAHDLPIVVTAVDEPEAIARLVDSVATLVERGMIAVSDVEAIWLGPPRRAGDAGP